MPVDNTKPEPSRLGFRRIRGRCNIACPDDHLTGAAAARLFNVSRSWCNTQRLRKKLTQLSCGHYQYRAVQAAEAKARQSGMVLRGARAASHA